MYLQQAKDQFNNIAEKTGILSSKKKQNPVTKSGTYSGISPDDDDRQGQEFAFSRGEGLHHQWT